MSKRVPVYMNERELKRMQSLLSEDLAGQFAEEKEYAEDFKFLAKLEEQLEQFDEN